MILRSMTAVYGRLDGETLALQPGLNVLEAPNEAGKSTWAAFLLAMLYGVDTGQRATRTALPEKARCLPWSGKPPQGRMELTWQGRDVTLERTTSGRLPLGRCRAYDTAGGGEIAALAGGDWGRQLLGVERSVYERSGFLRGGALVLTADHALEARLNALVASGDEGASAGAALERLRERRNRLGRARTGRLDQARGELARVTAQLEELRDLGRTCAELEARLADLEARRARLTREAAEQQAGAEAEVRRRLEEARAAWERERGFLAEKAGTVAGLPELPTLQELLRRLEPPADDDGDGGPEPPLPELPPALAGLDADGVLERAAADGARLARLEAPPQLAPGRAGLLAALAVAAAGLTAAAAWLVTPWAAVPGGAIAALLAALAAVRARRNRRARAEAAALLAGYGAANGGDLQRIARQAGQALGRRARWAAAKADAEAARQAARQRRETALLAEVQSFAPEVQTPEAARAAVRRAVHLRQFHAAAQRSEAQARVRYEALRDAVGSLPAGGPGEPARLASVRQELEDVRSRLDVRRGRLEASGDPAELEARREALAAEIAGLERECAALDLAMDAMGRADEALRARFAPQIHRLAGEYLARLTGGRYDCVLLDRTMAVRVREAGGTVTRPAAALSSGTADQLYLAVRLAVSQTLLPPEAPLVLDDALLAFDDGRHGAAMALLQDLGRQRQILLFTCQGRERAWLETHGKD